MCCICVPTAEAIFISIMALLNPGDEVVALEPAFDIYWAQTEMAGAVLKTVPLRVVHTPASSSSSSSSSAADSKDSKASAGGEARWGLDWKEFEAAFTPKTRMLLLNTPHNPTGKVFSRAELEHICQILKKFPKVVVVADEVYEVRLQPVAGVRCKAQR